MTYLICPLYGREKNLRFDLQRFDSVSYVDENGETQNVDATTLTGSETTLSAGWYVVNSNITRSNTLYLNGDVKLILADNYEFKIENSNEVNGIAISGTNLTVYGQTNQSGKLTVNNETAGDPAIKLEGNNGTFVVNGGIIDVTSNTGSGKEAENS